MTAPARAGRASRDAAAVSTWNLLSRLTGVARVVILGGALGATRLGDTYQGANQVSNVLFELLAAGTLSAILVPGLVGRLGRTEVAQARAFAGAVLGRCLLILVPLVALAVLAARPLAALLFTGNDDASQPAQRRLGAFLLVFVLPQLLLYAWGAVVTAVLHAAGRFTAASLAPVANNVVVSAGLGLFWYRGAHGVRLDTADQWLLGATALGGVVAMTAVPALAAWRAGLGVVPRFRGTDITGVGRDALWGSLALLPAQVVAFGSLLVAGRVGGGVAAYQIAFTFFLLPYALVAHPTATVLYPRLARAAGSSHTTDLRALAGSGLDVMTALLFVAAAVAAALAPWLVRVVAVGELAAPDGRRLTATVLAWLAVGLPAFGVVLLLTRLGYAANNVRLPAFAAIGGAVVGVVVLLVATTPDAPDTTIATVAFAHSAMACATAAGLLATAVRQQWIEVRWGAALRYATAAVLAGVTARLTAETLATGSSRLGAIVVAAVGALVAIGVYALVLYGLGVRRLPRLAVEAT